MPTSALGQLITLAIQLDHDPATPAPQKYVLVVARSGDTCQSIASRLGHPEDARAIADLNAQRSTTGQLNAGGRYRVPARLRPEQVLNVLAGDNPPKIVGGFAKFTTIDRFSRTGLNQFTGYDPLQMSVPLRFEALSYQITQGFTQIKPNNPRPTKISATTLAHQVKSYQDNQAQDVESQIRLLERMAGRGAFSGAGIGPPPVIRATTTDADGNVIGLIPKSYQWTKANAGPLWRLSGLEWDDGALRNASGNRIRATCTVTLTEHTHSSLASQSAAARAS